MKPGETLDLPKQILDVCTFLDRLELPAWLVGGCLRDICLGRTPTDWDLATPCPPDTVREKLEGAGISLWDTGLRHGTLTFRFHGASYEITTFRQDGPYEDFRRPKWVAFTGSLHDDLARRDFTINAMAYHWKEGLTDPFGGMEDIEKQVIRAVGSAEARLEEDALRILRGIRFAGSLGFALDGALSAAMVAKAELLRWISPERLAMELRYMVMQPSPAHAMGLLAEIGLWPYLAPEMVATVGFDQNSAYHHLSVYDHMVQTLEHVPAELEIRLAALFHDVAKPVVHTVDEEGKSHFHRHELVGADLARGILNRLRYSHGIRNQVLMLIRHHMLHLKTLSDERLRQILSDLPKPRADNLERILKLQKADLLASRYTEASMEAYESFAQRSKAILDSGCPLDLTDLEIKGEELESLGIAPANRGKALKAMLAEVIRDPAQNQREVLLEIAATFTT